MRADAVVTGRVRSAWKRKVNKQRNMKHNNYESDGGCDEKVQTCGMKGRCRLCIDLFHMLVMEWMAAKHCLLAIATL